jgi:hypothetical protein
VEDVRPTSDVLAAQERTSVMDEETIKQIFFQSDRPRRNALVADEVDIVQFANNVAALVRVRTARAEHQRCVRIVAEFNEDIARELEQLRP